MSGDMVAGLIFGIFVGFIFGFLISGSNTEKFTMDQKIQMMKIYCGPDGCKQ